MAMIRVIYGKAGTGKTTSILGELALAVSKGIGGYILLVPEQYSHEAERELCKACGDSTSLYAEVMSFTGLARNLYSEYGGREPEFLDKGGRFLCLYEAMELSGGKLNFYGSLNRKADRQELLLQTIDELKAAGITAERLSEAAARCEDSVLRKKLEDLCVLMNAYKEAILSGKADPADRLTNLCRFIGEKKIGEGLKIYADGFTDFTFQEYSVLFALAENGADLTVCLTIDPEDPKNEIFAMSVAAAEKFHAFSKKNGIEFKGTACRNAVGKDSSAAALAKNILSIPPEKFEGESNVKLCSAASVFDECEMAAGEILRLVREKDCRWRDIAVAIRGFERYETALKSTFDMYSIPLFLSKKSNLLSKPFPAMIAGVYEIICGGWNREDIITYIRYGLTGESREDCDLLENYLNRWRLWSSAWHSEKDWRRHPDGFGAEITAESEEKLARINAVRKRIAKPLLSCEAKEKEAKTAEEHLKALAEYLTEAELAQRLDERAAELRETGAEELASEYAVLWKTVVNALEQAALTLGDSPMNTEDFGKLIIALLSRYETGRIPVALDRVAAGDFDRMRRRNIRHLLILGASNEALPAAGTETGVFTGRERQELKTLDIDIKDDDQAVWAEYTLIYNCLSLPSESLYMSYTSTDEEGNIVAPSFIMEKASKMFGEEIRPGDVTEAEMSALSQVTELAANSLSSPGEKQTAAAEYLRRNYPARLETLQKAAGTDRGSLSSKSVRQLYGSSLKLNPTRADTYVKCAYAYFCKYGLKTSKDGEQEMDAAQYGSFIHYVLEHTASDIKKIGGFKKAKAEDVEAAVSRAIKAYAEEVLGGLSEQSGRFKHLFSRLENDAKKIAFEMAEELKSTDFEPLNFELDLSENETLGVLKLGDGKDTATLTGKIDRVDGFEHNGKLYIRIADYKTGAKKFNISNISYGLDLQMLLYLFALEKNGSGLYGSEVVPAGIMYVPAKFKPVTAKSDISDADIKKARFKDIRRTGLVTDDPEIIAAWENNEEKKILMPSITVSTERMGALSRHVERCLTGMAEEIRKGRIEASPLRSEGLDSCQYCEYKEVCRFTDGINGDKVRFRPKRKNETAWEQIEGETQ